MYVALGHHRPVAVLPAITIHYLCLRMHPNQPFITPPALTIQASLFVWATSAPLPTATGLPANNVLWMDAMNPACVNQLDPTVFYGTSVTLYSFKPFFYIYNIYVYIFIFVYSYSSLALPARPDGLQTSPRGRHAPSRGLARTAAYLFSKLARSISLVCDALVMQYPCLSFS